MSIGLTDGRARAGRSASLDVSTAIDRAVRFLLRARHRDGWWRDFDTLAGWSDEWVSAFVACVLARAERDDAKAAAWDIWKKLVRRQSWSGGWGYNTRVPADADSTLWVLRLAAALRVSDAVRVRRAHAFLDRHVKADGSIATYATPGPIRFFTRVGRSYSFAGWCAPHVCVSALGATVRIPAQARIRNFVRQAQSFHGSWDAYWWCDSEYATALAVAALAGNSTDEDRQRIARASVWATCRLEIEPPLLPFASAWLLSILNVSGSSSSHLRTALSMLLDAQAPDGSWAASARLRIPPPDVVEPDRYERWVIGGRGGGSIVLDSACCFTTASALGALCGLDD